jgi:hypothetical protein
MPWTATPTQWGVRWGNDHHKYGDDYQGVATLTRVGDKGYVSQTCGTGLTIKEMREFFQFCREHGIKMVEWDHHGIPGRSR